MKSGTDLAFQTNFCVGKFFPYEIFHFQTKIFSIEKSVFSNREILLCEEKRI